MPKQDKRLEKKLSTSVDADMSEQINEAVEESGVKSKAAFIRMAVMEKVRKVLANVKKKKPLVAALVLPFFPLEAFPAILALFFMGLVAYYSLMLIFGEEREQAGAWKALTACIIAGVLLATARPVGYYITGWGDMKKTDNTYYLDKNGNGKYDEGEPQIPAALVEQTNKMLDLLMYVGVILIIAGIIIGGIKLSYKPPPPCIDKTCVSG